MRKINIPIFVSHQGCPNDCIFCNQKKITGVYKKEKWEEIREKISSYIKSAPNECEIEISFFGGSFTGIDFDEQNMYLDIANEFLYDKRIKGIRLSTRPDYINDKILKNLKEKNVTAIELGVQSMNDRVLDMNKRGLKCIDTINASNLIKEYGFELGLQMMVGMYGSDYDEDINTAKELIKLKPHCVRIYPTVVIKETELYDLYKCKAFVPYTLEKAVTVCSKLLMMFEENNIKVIRLGLMASDEINEKTVFGPYHSSFRELCESYILYNEIRDEVKKNKYGENINIYCNKKNISKIIGNKRCNINKLKDEFGFKNINIIAEKTDKMFDIKNSHS